MGVVIGHKSKLAMRAVVRGKAAHSAQAHLGVNAVEVAADVIALVRAHARRLAESGPRDGLYEVPYTTGGSTIVGGGTVHNIIPERAEVIFEYRGIAADDLAALRERIVAEARATIEPAMQAVDPACGIDFEDIIDYPVLETAPDHALVTLAKDLAGRNSHGKVAYGTEAGLFVSMAGIPSVVIGPGSIDEAHRPDEFVALSELVASARFIERLIAHCSR